MIRRKQAKPEVVLAPEFYELAKDMYMKYFRVHKGDWVPLRKRLIALLLREVKTHPKKAAAWNLLGDTYCWRAKRMACYKAAVSADPKNAEAHGELALLYAPTNRAKYFRHFDMALEHCRGCDVEEDIIRNLISAAQGAKDSVREQRATSLEKK